ncbi:hypothetical protein CLV97_10157 [Planifilum fimeticola]|jgi:hypothetical protein|uniref:DUF2292 domain-containing protein n=1 Tax=Planifilum fimeticola TaxID=201975 RepID=A0A2T0LJ67_9BACL|nr:YezD family protein [Planifilum fimeticola]PRX42569.1 hypothetical protein CLV97_10157 [Planifilum fimeticola]
MNAPSISQSQIRQIIRALEGLEYGTVLITVHNSQIVQIDRTEKHRFPPASSNSAPDRSARKPTK